MVKMSTLIVRIAMLVMIFQCFAPLFLPTIVQEISISKESCYNIQHTSIAAAVLLKEKDEKQHEEKFYSTKQTAILDFCIHTLNLKASHSDKLDYISNDVLYNAYPRLFTTHCTFLI